MDFIYLFNSDIKEDMEVLLTWDLYEDGITFPRKKWEKQLDSWK